MPGHFTKAAIPHAGATSSATIFGPTLGVRWGMAQRQFILMMAMVAIWCSEIYLSVADFPGRGALALFFRMAGMTFARRTISLSIANARWVLRRGTIKFGRMRLTAEWIVIGR